MSDLSSPSSPTWSNTVSSDGEYGYLTLDHSEYLADHIGTFYDNPQFSDVTLVVGHRKFPAHRLVLVARSEYFRAMFGGNFTEARPSNNEVKLHIPSLHDDDAADAFHHLLRYIYSGQFSTEHMLEDVLPHVVLLADQYNFVELHRELCDHICDSVSNSNVLPLYEYAKGNGINKLQKFCLKYLDTHFCEMLNNMPTTPQIVEQFKNMREDIFVDIISRKTLEVPEIKLVAAVDKWIQEDKAKRADSDIKKNLRLYLMNDDCLLNKCPKYGISAETILDALRMRSVNKNAIDQAVSLFTDRPAQNNPDEILHTGWCKPFYRGFLVPDINLADPALGANTYKRVHDALLTGCQEAPGFVSAVISGEKDNHGIGICFVRACIINTIRMKLYDDDGMNFSYKVDSYDFQRKTYVPLVNYSSEICRSWQILHFSPVFTGIIRIVGTRGPLRTLRLSKFEAYFRQDPPPWPTKLQCVVPKVNIATPEFGAWVLKGKNMDKLLNGEYVGYDGPDHCTQAKIGESIIVQLSQPYVVGSLSFLLLDTHNRAYSYKVEVNTGANNEKWEIVADTGRILKTSLQVIRFRERQVTYIKVTGMRSSIDGYLHLVHLECPASESALSREDPPSFSQ